MDYTISQIEKRYNQLFKDIKEMISSAETTKQIDDIGSRAKLHIDQKGELIDETGLLMLGLTKPNEYVGNLKIRLNISTLLAEQIAKEINEKVLYKIRDSIKEMSRVEMPDEEIKELQEELKEEGLILDNTKIDPNLDRKRMLGEIEDPTKIDKRIEKNKTPIPVIEQKNSGRINLKEESAVQSTQDYNKNISQTKIKDTTETIKSNIINHELPVDKKDIIKPSKENLLENKDISNNLYPTDQILQKDTSQALNKSNQLEQLKQTGFVQNKLEKPSSVPMKENITEEGVVIEKKKPKTDPYREPLV